MSPSAVLSMLHQVNQDEIRLGKTAESKAQNDKVKGYAKDMVDDHTALDKKLTDFVQKEGKGEVTLSSSQIPSNKRQELKTMTTDAERKLGSATGATFDREYMSAMLKGHDAVLSDLEAALPSLEGKDKVHDLVSDARDKVEDHRESRQRHPEGPRARLGHRRQRDAGELDHGRPRHDAPVRGRWRTRGDHGDP